MPLTAIVAHGLPSRRMLIYVLLTRIAAALASSPEHDTFELTEQVEPHGCPCRPARLSMRSAHAAARRRGVPLVLIPT